MSMETATVSVGIGAKNTGFSAGSTSTPSTTDNSVPISSPATATVSVGIGAGNIGFSAGSTSTPFTTDNSVPISSSATLSGCDSCTVAVGTSGAVDDLGGASTSLASTIVFTSAYIESDYPSDGKCSISQAYFTQITPYFTATRSGSVGDDQFQSDAAFAFATFLGLTSCSPSIKNVVLAQVENLTSTTTDSFDGVPAIASGSTLNLLSRTSAFSSTVVTTAPSSNTSSSNNTSPSSSTSTPPPPAKTSSSKASLSTDAKIGISFAAFGVVLILILSALATYLIRRRRKRKQKLEGKSTPSESDQPYFQPKGELDAEGNVKAELHAESRRNELDGENEIHELPGVNGNLGKQNIHKQELKGEEHSKELECNDPV